MNWLKARASVLQSTVGTDWEVLSFDPREFRPTAQPEIDLSYLACPSRHAGGVGISGPVLKQFDSPDEETSFWKSVVKPGAYESHGNLTMSKDVGFL